MITSTIEQVTKEMRSHPFTLLTVLALILFAAWSTLNYARASDIAEIKAASKNNSEKIDRVLRLQLAEALRSVQRQLCASDSAADRHELQRTIDGLQEDYREIEGANYPIQECRA